VAVRATPLESVIYNLRFPGQIYDSQAGLQQNYFRDYDPAIGRYVESDPIGLKAGVNTYAYVNDNPVMFIDSDGQLCIYSQGTGSLTCTNDITQQRYLTCKGYAGNGWGLNNPAAQDVENVGPLPRGDYTVGPANRRRGPLTLPLSPVPGTDLRGRPGPFLIHGDNNHQDYSASKGCIVAPRNCRASIPTGETVRVVP
jgi:RHS repeat-associated protein